MDGQPENITSPASPTGWVEAENTDITSPIITAICIRPVKNLSGGVLAWLSVWSEMPLTVSCFSKIQIGFIFLVPAHPGSPGKGAIKQVCVSVYL